MASADKAAAQDINYPERKGNTNTGIAVISLLATGAIQQGGELGFWGYAKLSEEACCTLNKGTALKKCLNAELLSPACQLPH